MTYIEKIVDAFGGVRPLAAAMARPVSTVSSWKRRGSIPDDQKPDILKASDALGLGLTPADFFPFDNQDQVAGKSNHDTQ